MVVGDFPAGTGTIVIRTGPGGYVAIIRAAQLGQKVTVIGKGNLGGVCLNVGCIPSKALLHTSHRFVEAQHSENLGVITESVSLSFQGVQKFRSSVVNKLTDGAKGLLRDSKVNIVKDEVYFVDNSSLRTMDGKSAQMYNFRNAIIATGLRPIEILNFKFGRRVIDSTGALNLQEVLGELVVAGGGYIGLELGTAFANFDSEATILEGAKDILGGFEKQMTQSVKKGMKEKGIEIATEAMTKSVEEADNGAKITCEAKGRERTVEADYILVTIGRRPNADGLSLEELGVKFADRGLLEVDKQSRTSISNIYAIGNIVPGLPLAHRASYEAKVAAEAIDDQAAGIDYIGMPAVRFIEPELATVGYSEVQAKGEDLAIKASKFPYAADDHALSLGGTNGFTKLITLKEDGTLIGAQVVGAGASDIISELGLAIEAGMDAGDIVLAIYAHPTLGGMTMEAAERAIGCPIRTT